MIVSDCPSSLYIGFTLAGAVTVLLLQAQLALSLFGSSYKKAVQFKQDGRHNEPLYGGSGREEAAVMWEAVATLFPVDMQPLSVSASDPKFMVTLLSSTWLYGQSSDFHAVTSMPNGLGSLRLLVSGVVRWLLFPLAQLLPFIKRSLGKDDLSTSVVADWVGHLDEGKLTEMSAEGFFAQYVEQQADQLLFVPTGYFACEMSLSGSLVYGCRRVVMHKTEESHLAYECVHELAVGDGSANIEKMKQLLDAMALES
eukprot:6492749-Amphidinium_carterae.1